MCVNEYVSGSEWVSEWTMSEQYIQDDSQVTIIQNILCI